MVPFTNANGAAALDWMVTALPVVIAEKLESSPRLRPCYGPKVLDGFDRLFELDKVAERARARGAKWVLGGTVARPHWQSEVQLRLYEVVDGATENDPPQLRLVTSVSSVEDSKRLFEQLSVQLKKLLAQGGITVDPEVEREIDRKPCRDVYALTLFGRAFKDFLDGDGGAEKQVVIDLLHRVERIDPQFAAAERLLGLVYQEAGDLNRAAAHFAHALDLRPGYFAATAGLAEIYRVTGNRPRARELFEAALVDRPYDSNLRFGYGELLAEVGELDAALRELERVVKASPRDVPARRALAQVFAAQGETASLAAELEKVESLAPLDLDVKLDLGSAYQQMGLDEKAIEAYQQVLLHAPKHLAALKLLGDCYRRKKEPERAISAYSRIKKLAPDDPRPYFLLGAAYEEAGEFNHAEAQFQDAQQFKRYLGEAWTNLGSLALRRGDLNSANWYLSRAVLRAPSRPKAHYNYALVLSARRDQERALDELRIAGELDPRDAEVHYLSGVILLKQGRLQEAQAQFVAALKLNPKHADARHNLDLLEDLSRRYGGEHSSWGSQ